MHATPSDTGRIYAFGRVLERCYLAIPLAFGWIIGASYRIVKLTIAAVKTGFDAGAQV